MSIYFSCFYTCVPHPLKPYNLGLVSARPFTVLAEYGPPLFQRGVLHVYYHSIQLHVFIVHLHAHSSKERSAEANKLLEVSVLV
jgi:hypothetical protein